MDQPTSTPADLDAFLGVAPPSRRARFLKWGLIALGAVLLLWLASRFLGGTAAPSYVTEPVERGDLTVTVSATGNLAPTNEIEVGSEVSGLITQVFVDNNDRVTKGQELARLDTSRLQDAINQSRAQLASAQAQVAQATATAQQSRANLKRLTDVYRLSGGKVPSATELDTGRADAARAEAGIRTAEAAVAQARAQLSSNQTEFGKASIRSPVTGVVLSRSIDPGNTVAASFNAPVLFKIAEDLSAMRLEVKVDEADVGQVAKGQRATFTVDAFPGRRFPARIERVDVGANASGTSSTSTATTGTGSVVAYTARLTVANPDLILRPGMTATADIVTTEKRGVLLVPNAALRFNPERAGRGGQSGGVTSVLVPRGPQRRGQAAPREATIGRGSRQTVYVVDEDGTPEAVKVTVGDTNGSQTEVSGRRVQAGMRVITGQRSAEAAAGSGSSSSSGGGQRRRASGGGQAGQ